MFISVINSVVALSVIAVGLPTSGLAQNSEATTEPLSFVHPATSVVIKRTSPMIFGVASDIRLPSRSVDTALRNPMSPDDFAGQDGGSALSGEYPIGVPNEIGERGVQTAGGSYTSLRMPEHRAGALDDGLVVDLGLGVSEALSLRVSRTETHVNVGATLLVPAFNGVSLTAGVSDAVDDAGRQQYGLSAAFSF